MFDTIYINFLVGAVVSCSLVISMMIISTFIWLPMSKHQTVNELLYDTMANDILYVHHYDDAISGYHFKEGDPKTKTNQLENTFLLEYTPRGNVLMAYKNGQFEYYADTTDIPYRYLDAVVKKFVAINHCVDIYVKLQKQILEETVKKTPGRFLNKEIALDKTMIPLRHSGKISQFPFLQKIPIKQVDKKRALTFEEYKALKAGMKKNS